MKVCYFPCIFFIIFDASILWTISNKSINFYFPAKWPTKKKVQDEQRKFNSKNGDQNDSLVDGEGENYNEHEDSNMA